VRSWDRASFELNTVSPKRRIRIRRRDLLLPANHSRLKLFGACVGCGVAASILYVWFPLVFWTIAFNRPIGPRVWLIVLIAAVVTSLALFVVASRQMARYREYAAEI
jgi:hypothetical protein